MGGLVDAEREAADNGLTHGGQLAAQLARLLHAVAGRSSRSDHRHSVGRHLAEVAFASDPQADRFAATVVQRAGVAQRSESVGPLGVGWGEKPDAAALCLLKRPARVDVGELVADREGPVRLNLGGVLDVAEDLARPEVAGLDGAN